MEFNFDGTAVMEIIRELVTVPSPAGFTDQVIAKLEAYLNSLGIPNHRNRKGGLLATLQGQNTAKQRIVTAHLDTLGAMVKEIKPDGRLKLSLIGGSRWNHIEGEYCQVFASRGVYTGTILMHKTSVHVYKDTGTLERSSDTMEVRLDEKVVSADDVKKLGISVGDFVAFDPRVVLTPSGFIKSRHLDDKASAGILLYLIKAIKENRVILPYTTHILFSTHEEVGFGGNSNIPAEAVEYLAVDMGAVGDGQTSDEYSVCICAMDSTGPYNHQLRQRLVDLAEQHGLSYKVDIYPNYGSDASAALRAGHDLIHSLVGPGIDASHAFERTHMDAIVNTAKLVYYYLLSPIIGD